MLRKLMILCVAVSATVGVAIARPHGASAQGAVLCGLLRLPHAGHTAMPMETEIVQDGDLPCSSAIVSDGTPTPMPPSSTSRTAGTSASQRAVGLSPTAPPNTSVVHCHYSFYVDLTPTADPDILTGTGWLYVFWSDGGGGNPNAADSHAVVTVVAARTAAGITAMDLTGSVDYGRGSGSPASLMNLQVATVGALPVVQLELVWA